MTITREDVADLRPGDILEYADPKDPSVITRGPVREVETVAGRRWLMFGSSVIRTPSGDANDHNDRLSRLTLVERVPRPVYVNHIRTEPVPGDVMREEDPEGATTWLMDSFQTWQSKDSTHQQSRGFQWPLTLLVDGETGQVVQ